MKYLERGLTLKQSIFLEEYLLTNSLSEAARKSGYSEANAFKVVQNKKVKKVLDEEREKRKKRFEVTEDRIITELAKMAFVNIDDIVDLQTGKIKEDVEKEDLSTIESYEHFKQGRVTQSKVKLHNKQKALEMLGKHLGMFVDKSEVALTGKVEFVDDISNTEET